MVLEKLLQQAPGAVIRGDPRLEISGISHDSRRVRAGDLFVALPGTRTDGVQHIPDAIARGAAAFACERPAAHEGAAGVLVRDARRFLAEAAIALYGRPAEQMRLVALTGTNGKTTSSYLIDAILRQAGLRRCLVGTLGMRIDEALYPSSFTTPEAPELAAFLRQAADCGCTHGTLEVSSHALASKRVFGTRFFAGVFSNLTPEHLDFHGSMESYYGAKRLLFTAEGHNSIERAVINTDDPYGRRLAGEAECPVIRYGRSPEADVRVLDFQTRREGTEMRAETPLGRIEMRTHLVGTPNVYNVLAALGAALSLGIGPETMRAGIESVTGVPGRMELVGGGIDYTVVVDYAHTPDALEKLLMTVGGLPHSRIITVFGCGGDRDRQKRPLMGEIAGRLSNYVIATSDNPRSEDPGQILAGIEPGLRQSGRGYRIEPDRRHAIFLAVSMAAAGDIVVLAGKGHEDYQIIGGRVLPLDDRIVALEAIRQLSQPEGARN